MRRSIVGFIVVVVAACSSDDATSSVVYDDPEVSANAANADGVAYPTDHLGGVPRAGNKRGDRIPNFAFHGYPDSNRAGGLKTISLSDYYDPEQKRAKVLHLMVAAVWCPVCDALTKEIVPARGAIADKRVTVLQAIIHGKRYGIGPTLGEVDGWMVRYPTWNTVVIDDRAKRVGTITEIDGLPWNAMIDVRTMEILATFAGQPTNYAAVLDQMTQWVDTHPPSY